MNRIHRYARSQTLVLSSHHLVSFGPPEIGLQVYGMEDMTKSIIIRAKRRKTLKKKNLE